MSNPVRKFSVEILMQFSKLWRDLKIKLWKTIQEAKIICILWSIIRLLLRWMMTCYSIQFGIISARLRSCSQPKYAASNCVSTPGDSMNFPTRVRCCFSAWESFALRGCAVQCAYSHQPIFLFFSGSPIHCIRCSLLSHVAYAVTFKSVEPADEIHL